MSGLHAASTEPFAMPKSSVPPKRLQKSHAKIVSRMPATCPTSAIQTMRPMPIASQSGPPKIIASVKPQKAVLLIQPACSLVRPNSAVQLDMAPPRMAKLMAVTIKARQLA